MKAGAGKFTVNGRDHADLFRPPDPADGHQPAVQVLDRIGQYDIVCTVAGGGLSVRRARSATASAAPCALRSGSAPVLKHCGFLTRDDREVERKKYGKAKARRSFQFSKR